MMIRFCITALILIAILFSACQRHDDALLKEPLYLPDDLEAHLWAESPMFYNPTNIDIDSRGRVWVTEAVNYRNYNNDSTHVLHHGKGDRVIILEDSDHDGKADLSKVFVQDEDLVSPLGIAVIGNKVYVSCSPNLIVYTDENGDDKPDSKEIFLTGFGGKDHDHSLHAITGGPDGYFYFNTGNAGPHLVKDKAGWTLRSGSLYTGGSPYNLSNQGNMKSDDGKIWVGGLALRINNDGKELSVRAHNFRNAYELFVDSQGDMWQNDNDDQVVACRTSWVMEGGNAGYFSTDGTRYWQADQRPGQEIFTAHWHQEDPGVMPAGDNSGAGAPTGIVMNEGDALGAKYNRLLLSADAGRNVIFGYHPTKDHSGFDLGKRSNFISSLKEDNERYVWNDDKSNSEKDKWFRPSDVAIGTDGAIYVADWYDPVVGGHQMQDSLGYGRIYRITPKGKKLAAPALNMTTPEGQLQALKSPAVNVRYEAFEKLRLQGESVIPGVKKLIHEQNIVNRSRAIWLLSRLGSSGRSEVVNLLKDPDETTRIVALRALRQSSDSVLMYAQQLVNDPSPFVRREVIVALADLSFEKTKPLLTELMKSFDGKDRWYLEALGSSVKGHETEMYTEALGAFGGKEQSPESWNGKLEAIAWRLHPASVVKALKARASSSVLTDAQRSRAMTALAFIPARESAQAMISLVSSPSKKVSEDAKYWISFRQGNDWFSLIDWSKTGIDTEYERQVATMNVKMGKVLDERLPFDEKKWNAQDMAKDPVGAKMLLGLVSEKKLPRDLYPVVEKIILDNPDQAVRIQASLYFKKPGEGKSYSIPAIAKMNSDAGRGEMLFNTNCATCHRVKGKGADIGPELTSIGKKFDRGGLLDAIINPGAGIVFGYEAWTIKTTDGQSYFGFLIADGEKAVVLKDLSGKKHTITNSKISVRQKQQKSVMPEPSSLNLSAQDLADITAFLIE